MAASRLGRGAQGILLRDVMSMTRLNNPAPTGRLFSTSLGVQAISKRGRHRRGQTDREISPKVANREERNKKELSPEAVNIFLPGTFILPLPSRLPRNPSELFPLLKNYVINHGRDFMASVAMKLSSMSTFFSRPKLKLKSASAVVAAKALHRSMCEAIASGDKRRLTKICSIGLADKLVGSIDVRPKGQCYSWELVRYNKAWRYPRIVSQKLAKLDADSSMPLCRQIVVRICSRQRRAELDAKGNVVPGSEKEADLVENVVLTAMVNPLTYQQSEWRITGTAKDTNLKSWAEDLRVVEALQQQA